MTKSLSHEEQIRLFVENAGCLAKGFGFDVQFGKGEFVVISEEQRMTERNWRHFRGVPRELAFAGLQQLSDVLGVYAKKMVLIADNKAYRLTLKREGMAYEETFGDMVEQGIDFLSKVCEEHNIDPDSLSLVGVEENVLDEVPSIQATACTFTNAHGFGDAKTSGTTDAWHGERITGTLYLNGKEVGRGITQEIKQAGGEVVEIGQSLPEDVAELVAKHTQVLQRDLAKMVEKAKDADVVESDETISVQQWNEMESVRTPTEPVHEQAVKRVITMDEDWVNSDSFDLMKQIGDKVHKEAVIQMDRKVLEDLSKMTSAPYQGKVEDADAVQWMNEKIQEKMAHMTNEELLRFAKENGTGFEAGANGGATWKLTEHAVERLKRIAAGDDVKWEMGIDWGKNGDEPVVTDPRTRYYNTREKLFRERLEEIAKKHKVEVVMQGELVFTTPTEGMRETVSFMDALNNLSARLGVYAEQLKVKELDGTCVSATFSEPSHYSFRAHQNADAMKEHYRPSEPFLKPDIRAGVEALDAIYCSTASNEDREKMFCERLQKWETDHGVEIVSQGSLVFVEPKKSPCLKEDCVERLRQISKRLGVYATHLKVVLPHGSCFVAQYTEPVGYFVQLYPQASIIMDEIKELTKEEKGTMESPKSIEKKHLPVRERMELFAAELTALSRMYGVCLDLDDEPVLDSSLQEKMGATLTTDTFPIEYKLEMEGDG